jgi:ammonium transporter Rh
MGVIAHLAINPAAAMAAGCLGGLISVLGFKYVSPFLRRKLHIQDICGEKKKISLKKK